MANPEHLAKLLAGIERWNAWKQQQSHEVGLPFEADFSGADLSKVNAGDPNLNVMRLRRDGNVRADLRSVDFSSAWLNRADLNEADLTGADLRRADMSRAKLGRATLLNANISGAQLTGADLRGADLTGADLSGATLIEVDFSQACLSNSNFSDALFWETKFVNTDLASSVGLHKCNHLGPSALDFRTVSRSGQLPVAFLRGCGLPDNLIDHLPSLLNRAIQFYSCFISYSTQDQEFADRLHADLQNSGVRCWFAPHKMKGGEKIHEQIDEAIRIYDRLLLVLSEESMKSRWVKTEIANARRKEAEQGRKVLFPIRLVDFGAIRPWKLFDAYVGDDSAAEVREYFIPDFSRWRDHDSYGKAFGRLLDDLKANDAGAQRA